MESTLAFLYSLPQPEGQVYTVLALDPEEGTVVCLGCYPTLLQARRREREIGCPSLLVSKLGVPVRGEKKAPTSFREACLEAFRSFRELRRAEEAWSGARETVRSWRTEERKLEGGGEVAAWYEENRSLLLGESKPPPGKGGKKKRNKKH